MALTLNSTGVVIVDDNDPEIVYQPPGAWTRSGIAGVEHRGTTHGAHVIPATAAFRFNGALILVFSRQKKKKKLTVFAIQRHRHCGLRDRRQPRPRAVFHRRPPTRHLPRSQPWYHGQQIPHSLLPLPAPPRRPPPPRRLLSYQRHLAQRLARLFRLPTVHELSAQQHQLDRARRHVRLPIAKRSSRRHRRRPRRRSRAHDPDRLLPPVETVPQSSSQTVR